MVHIDKSFLAMDGASIFRHTSCFMDVAPPCCSGHVKIIQHDGSRSRVHHEDHNVVVQLSRKSLAYMLAAGRLAGQDPAINYTITKLKFGNCGYSNDSQIITPRTPDLSDTGLFETNQDAIFTTSVSVVSVVQRDSSPVWCVTFRGIMDVGEGFGDGYRNYTEMLLCTDNDDPFAHKTFPSFLQVPGRKYETFWTITF